MKQHIISGSIAAAVAAAVAGIAHYEAPKHVEQVQPSIAVSKHAWPDLTTAQKDDLAQRLGAIKGSKILLICADATCTDLAQDIDDAAEQAGVDSALDRPVLPLGYGIDVFGDPDNDKAAVLQKALVDVTNLPVQARTGKANGYLMVEIGKFKK